MTSKRDTYAEVHDDLDSLMGDVGTASLLVCHLAMKMENDGHADRTLQGALYSLPNLLDSFQDRGNGIFSRMVALECAESEAGRRQER